jgi:hypothetical protein
MTSPHLAQKRTSAAEAVKPQAFYGTASQAAEKFSLRL